MSIATTNANNVERRHLESGRPCPLFVLRAGLCNGALWRCVLRAGMVGCLCLTFGGHSTAQGQARIERRIARGIGLRLAVDQEAFKLLQRKIRPTSDFRGEQVSEVRGRVSQEQVEGNTHGLVRVDYVSPAALKGNILIYGPNIYRNYHRATNTAEIAFWPTNEVEQRVIAAIRQGRIALQRTGQEKVAGRDAAIIELTGPRLGTVKFWIDLETGIQLKHEVSGAAGLISRTYMSSIVVGTSAAVQPEDFNPRQMRNAAVSPELPKATTPFLSVQDAAGELPFAPVEPALLPTGYHLVGVWVFGPRAARLQGRGAVLLRYSDNLTNFTLFERVNPRPVARPRAGATDRDIQFWRVSVPTGELTVNYIGRLSPDEIRGIHDSLR